MDTRTKELFAIGASVTANCVPCLKFHLEKARQARVEEVEIRAAVNVGRMVRRGAAAEWDEAAKALLGKVGAAVSAAAGEEAETGCGCS